MSILPPTMPFNGKYSGSALFELVCAEGGDILVGARCATVGGYLGEVECDWRIPWASSTLFTVEEKSHNLGFLAGGYICDI